MTTNFKTVEFFRSARADELGFANYPSSETELVSVLANLAFVAYMLEIVRYNYGYPIRISSGYRCKELNDVVGGSPTSNHLIGLAVDINQGSKTENAYLFGILTNLKSILPINELINEKNYSWIHLSFYKL